MNEAVPGIDGCASKHTSSFGLKPEHVLANLVDGGRHGAPNSPVSCDASVTNPKCDVQ